MSCAADGAGAQARAQPRNTLFRSKEWHPYGCGSKDKGIVIKVRLHHGQRGAQKAGRLVYSSGPSAQEVLATRHIWRGYGVHPDPTYRPIVAAPVWRRRP